MDAIPFAPPTGSAHAHEIDWLFAGLMAVSTAILALVFGLVLTFCIRYRAGSRADRTRHEEKSWRLEIGWTAATLLLFTGLFVWGADLFMRLHRPPADATEIYVVARQWMWKAEHPGGQREINTLHLPVDRPVRLVLTSQDVIHDFAVPAFRVRQDVLPGRYESLWFTPTETGEFHLFCAEFCGTEHARMGGRIVVLTATAFADWLAGQGADASLAQAGAALFRQFGCSGCHGVGATVRAPPLDGLYGRPVPLEGGGTVLADDRYLRDSILMPRAEVAAGYEPVMPSFAGRIGENDLLKLIAYLKSLSPRETRP